LKKEVAEAEVEVKKLSIVKVLSPTSAPLPIGARGDATSFKKAMVGSPTDRIPAELPVRGAHGPVVFVLGAHLEGVA